ncbi:MAG: dihydrofolate reductase [Candidatus Omnitrophica bacterium CG11_big_fil_rev_8_21_14_0_20_64_10]|nr:MAG: dihydrofolate reductase [Candidatus Omnitrophica bacterium CG11_big_fil_rev_8_21_14_0_20_64_10]
MRISLIVAASANGVIGAQNKLPWRLPADLAHFKQLTLGHPILMGRKTFESIGKPLPGRTNIVITRKRGLTPEEVKGPGPGGGERGQATGALTAGSVERALELCAGAEEIFVIGGAELFRQTLDRADRIYLTRIHADFEGDTFLFEIPMEQWRETERQDLEPDDKNRYPYSFITLEKR